MNAQPAARDSKIVGTEGGERPDMEVVDTGRLYDRVGAHDARSAATTAEWLDALEDRFKAEETPGWRTPANRTEREYAARQARMAVQELRYRVAEFDAAVRAEA